MNFEALYKENKKAATELLANMWCSDPRNERQKAYADQIKRLIDTELFASKNYIPLVQCMDRYESCTDEEANNIFETIDRGLWEKCIAQGNFNPYRHQVEAWKVLTNTDGPEKSMVVTTGTGSGKTECFMLPLVNDLLQQPVKQEIQAIFLYPLNALMEDQKERLQTLLSGTDLKFAVYNGNMPHDAGDLNARYESERNEARRIQEERKKYPNIIPTRDEMYSTPPNIILTNPTMLEYMLLRQKDQRLFTPGSLRWVVIDETHTFSGAGAAELAMLIRRLLDAFSLKAGEVRFATSSATIGNARTEEEERANNEQLKEFISKITGVPLGQVELITGRRNADDEEVADPEVVRCRKLLRMNDYMKLTELFPEKNETIEDKLHRLDELCALKDAPLKAKVHFFYRVPNNGLRVQLTDFSDGVFKVKSSVPVSEPSSPYLELMRCGHCGEYFAVGESVPEEAHKYRTMTTSVDDLFSDDNADPLNRLVFGLTDCEIDNDDRDGNTLVKVEGDEFRIESDTFVDGWSVVQNVKYCCPYCHERVLGKDRNLQDEEKETAELNENAKVFRVQPSNISRAIAPGILRQLKQFEPNGEEKRIPYEEFPHHGQQFISFVDSRKAAAESTLKQNLLEERLWVYSRIYNELNRKQIAVDPALAEKINESRALYERYKSENERLAQIIKEDLDQLVQQQANKSLSWNEVYNLLLNEKECEWLAYQFVKKGDHDSEIDAETDMVRSAEKSKYVLSVMVDLLARRPRLAASPETMGLFTTVYPKLDRITEIPEAVSFFNDNVININGQGRDIDVAEWKNLLKLFLDNVARSNQSVYLKMEEIFFDIFSCQRYGTVKPVRRPVKRPHINEDNRNGNISTVVALLGALIPNPENKPLADVIYENREAINDVLDALWEELTEETGLIQIGQVFSEGHWQPDVYREEGNNVFPYRLNVADISFKTMERACLVDVRPRGSKFPVLRPVDTLFMGYSPYLIDGKPCLPKDKMQEWATYPYLNGMKDGHEVSESDVMSWAKEKRSILCENGLWGDNGCFALYLNKVHAYPEIFIQAEHTAQVNKLVARHSQELFKAHKLNVLACSTTMEMGVDLGSLELVLMTSIPPHPSNYKQRAGRSGRNDDTRSACITLCGSDSIGLRTLEHPMESLIKRKMQVPTVDLQSPQVIQRHANAHLLRRSGVFFPEPVNGGNNLGQEVIDFFTPYFFDQHQQNGTFTIRTNDAQAAEVYPDSGLGDETETRYREFWGYLNDADDTLRISLNTILQGTCFENGAQECIGRCKSDIQSVYESLEMKVNDISEAYIAEMDRLSNSANANDRNNVRGHAVNSGYGYLLRHKFSECLAQNMLTFLATNRFTPNANMPVEIIEYNVNQRRDNMGDFWFKKSNNPSYALHEAISQYVPGNTIVLENRASTVRGVEYTGQYKHTVTFKRLYTDGNTTVIDYRNRLKSPARPWSLTNREELMLVEPVAFIPDINEEYSRILEKNKYTQVSAQLIGAGEWQPGDSGSIIAIRSNRDGCEAKILYYNEGIGYGYCFCPNCGKTVLEKNVASGRYATLPEEMNNQVENNGNERRFHYHIGRLDYNRNGRGRKVKCYPQQIYRNVILGGLIQTDYCEIKLKDPNGRWMQRNAENDRLLITLGILFTKAYTEYINKDSGDISFTIMQNGHLCIFDTNPGGSGYSNGLASQQTMQAVIDKAMEMLDGLTSKDALLDRFTLRYLDKLDVDSAKEWMEMLKESQETIPQHISDVYPNAKRAVVEDIYKDFQNWGRTDQEKVIFVNADWGKWLYNPEGSSTQELTSGFKQRTFDIRAKSENIKVAVLDLSKVPGPAVRMMVQIEEWGKIYKADNMLKPGFMPLALIGQHFYFTTERTSTNANYDWARSEVYCMPADCAGEFGFAEFEIDFAQNNIKKFTLKKNEYTQISSEELGGIIEGKMQKIADTFYDHCRNNEGQKVEVTYQDEHLKSPVAMVTTLQFIEHFMKKIGRPFTLTFVNEEYGENWRGTTIFNNLTNDAERNEVLHRISEEWQKAINGDGMECTEISISTKKPRTLPHWRCLEFKYAGKALCIYPNGGIINEWFLRDKYYNVSVDDITAKEHIPLRRTQEIMYDAEIQDL